MTKGQEEADDEAVGEDEGSAAAHFYLHADGPATAGQCGNQLQSRPVIGPRRGPPAHTA